MIDAVQVAILGPMKPAVCAITSNLTGNGVESKGSNQPESVETTINHVLRGMARSISGKRFETEIDLLNNLEQAAIAELRASYLASLLEFCNIRLELISKASHDKWVHNTPFNPDGYLQQLAAEPVVLPGRGLPPSEERAQSTAEHGGPCAPVLTKPDADGSAPRDLGLGPAPPVPPRHLATTFQFHDSAYKTT